MLRIAIIALAAYATYRVAKKIYRQVPDDFEPVALLPAPERDAARD